jgi:hypothetical protein
VPVWIIPIRDGWLAYARPTCALSLRADTDGRDSLDGYRNRSRYYQGIAHEVPIRAVAVTVMSVQGQNATGASRVHVFWLPSTTDIASGVARCRMLLAPPGCAVVALSTAAMRKLPVVPTCRRRARLRRRANHEHFSARPAALKRGASRSSRTLAAGCDGRSGVAARVSRRRTTPRRTVKSCGPGAPTLALSFAG